MTSTRSHTQIAQPQQRRPGWRVPLLLIAVGCVWLVLAARLVQLQSIDRDELAGKANRQRVYTERIPAIPGELVDRHGRLLATSVTARSLFLVPDRIDDPAAVAGKLAETLRLDSDRLLERLRRNATKKFLWVKRRLDDDQAAAIRRLELPDGIWGFRDEHLRRYPQGRLAAHVLGLRDIDGNGRGGLEQRLDPLLRGRDGRRMLVRDARGRVIQVLDRITEPPRHGRTVVLTLDAVIQLYAERELDRITEEWKPHGACVCVVDPKSCELLAMASRPDYDPNDPANVENSAWKNRNIAAVFEPGSTFKPFIVAWAVQHGLLDRDETIFCERGAYRMGGRVLHDDHPSGWLSVSDVIARSSNIGMAKIGERLTNRLIYDATIAFGFGRPTGSELPGELSGLVRPLELWNSYSTGSVPMGHEIAVTPLQLITAHAALANRGQLKNPRLVRQVVDHEAVRPAANGVSDATTIVVSRLIRPDVAQWIVEGPMAEVVRRGTSRSARLDDYTVFGKSGTSQKLDPATGKYSTRSYVCSFVGGAPAKDPRILALVVVDEPTIGENHTGGRVAAPAVAEIIRKSLIHLRVSPQRSPLEAAER